MNNYTQKLEKYLQTVTEYIESYRWKEIKEFALTLSSSELISILQNLNRRYWNLFFRILPTESAKQVFINLDPQVASSLVESLTDNNLKEILSQIQPDNRAAFFEELPGIVTRKLFKLLPKEEVIETRELLGYPEDSIGRMMTPDYFFVDEHSTVDEAITKLRKDKSDIELVSIIYVINGIKELIGYVNLKKLMRAPGSQKVSDIMNREVISMKAYQDQEEAIQLFQLYDIPAIPVTDSNNILIGIVTFDDVFDVVEEETTEDIQKSSAVSPLEYKYIHTPYTELYKKRIGWLLFLLITAFLSAGVISLFQDLLQTKVLLSIFIPVLIGAGGNTGAQSSTLIIRALSLGELRLSQWKTALLKEFFIGLLIGFTLGLVLFSYTYLLYDQLRLALITGLSMIFLIIWSNIIGAMLPLIITRLDFDPAVVSNPFLATLVDTMGLIIYFSISLYILSF